MLRPPNPPRPPTDFRNNETACVAIGAALIAFFAALASTSAGETKPDRAVSRFSEQAATWDGAHAIEGTAIAPPWSWHASISADFLYGVGASGRSSQFRERQSFGLGLPKSLEAAIALPVGWTIGAKESAKKTDVSQQHLQDDDSGTAIGDPALSLLWSAVDATKGGFGLLLGLKGSAPAGDNDLMIGEGGFLFEPSAALAFQVLGARLSLNLAYRFRPEHSTSYQGERFEQDDDVVWRAGFRIPKKNDVAWSIMAEGMIGVATYEGPWPSASSRPVWIGGGVDFPVSRLNRLGLFAGAGLVGNVAPAFSAGLSFTWLPVLPDEDKDGVRGMTDECPLMKEDRDGFEDSDGCPDPDNDGDGVPDDEEQQLVERLNPAL